MNAARNIRQAVEAAPAPDQGVSFAGHRFWDANSGTWMVKVFPGEFYVTSKKDEVLVTVLGSCISACIRDPRTGIGGMNHFMLPKSHTGHWGDDSQSMRYGNFAMEKLINEMIKAGCSRGSMEIKVFGGGNVIDTRNEIGTQNAEFALRYLADEGLPCAVQDVGGLHPRRIHYFPATGRVYRRLLGTSENNVVAREETEYASRLSSLRTFGEIQLFGDD